MNTDKHTGRLRMCAHNDFGLRVVVAEVLRQLVGKLADVGPGSLSGSWIAAGGCRAARLDLRRRLQVSRVVGGWSWSCGGVRFVRSGR